MWNSVKSLNFSFLEIIQLVCRKIFWKTNISYTLEGNNVSVWKLKVFLTSKFPAQKMKLSIKDFFSNCDQIRRKLRIWSPLLKKSFMENFIF